MRVRSSVLVLCAGVWLVSCRPHESAEARKEEANTAAGKAGKVAYGVAKETDKAAKSVGHSLAVAAHNAEQGWKEAAKEDKAKKK